MKIKDDFITNSSSTAYVVYIPDNFTINNIDVDSQDFYNHVLQSYEEIYIGENNLWDDYDSDDLEFKAKMKEDCIELLKKFLEETKVNTSMDFGWCCERPYDKLTGLFKIFEDFIIAETETGADSPCQIINVNAKNKYMNKKREILKQFMEENK